MALLRPAAPSPKELAKLPSAAAARPHHRTIIRRARTDSSPMRPPSCSPHKVTQYKTGKASLAAQGKRRYDRKQKGYGGQTKPVFHKKAKTTKKVVLRLECTVCKYRSHKALKRCKQCVPLFSSLLSCTVLTECTPLHFIFAASSSAVRRRPRTLPCNSRRIDSVSLSQVVSYRGTSLNVHSAVSAAGIRSRSWTRCTSWVSWLDDRYATN